MVDLDQDKGKFTAGSVYCKKERQGPPVIPGGGSHLSKSSMLSRLQLPMNLDEEVRPYTTSAEREKTENLATLYSIIVSLEYLERAYVRDSVTGKE
jgi:hypothetical protein